MTHRPRLPPVFAGGRRRLVAALVLTGFGHAAVAGTSAFALSRVFHVAAPGIRLRLLVLLFVLAAAMGLLRRLERVLAERLSQDYVHALRLRLVTAALARPQRGSLGVTVARTTNDLTSIRNWVALGVAPLVSGVPLLVGIIAVLALLAPALALAVAVPLLALGAGFAAFSPVTYRRSRRLRRQRGRLASQIADTVLAREAIYAGGGRARERRRVAELSRELVRLSIARAQAAGSLRGLAATAAGFATASAVAVGTLTSVPTATVAAALTLIGVMASPVQDLGRVVEYRQAYRAAQRIVAPALDLPDAPDASPDPARAHALVAAPVATPVAALKVQNLALDLADPADDAEPGPPGPPGAGGTPRLPDLLAPPGSRVVLDVPDRAAAGAALETIAGLRPSTATICVAGHPLSGLAERDRRAVVGYAAQGMRIERGPLLRAVRYRVPSTSDEDAADQLRRFGLEATWQRLDADGGRELRHGGEPLTIPERALLLLARAMLGEPPLLVVDHLDNDLGPEGRVLARARLETYPGVLLLASEAPSDLVEVTHRWAVATTLSG